MIYPEVCWDYCFPRDGPGSNYVVVLVGQDRQSRATVAHVVPFKGADQEWVAEQCARDLLRFGLHGHVVLKSDQENVVVDVLREVAKLRGEQRTFVDQSPVGDSQGNGVAERALRAMEKLIRIHKLAFERKVTCKLSVTHALFPWLVEFCADIYNRFQIVSDGKRKCNDYEGDDAPSPSSSSPRPSSSGCAARSRGQSCLRGGFWNLPGQDAGHG